MAITFHAEGVRSRLQNRRRLKAFLQHQLLAQKPLLKRISLTYIFMTDENLLDINRRFLNHDTYTDIITFPLVNTGEELESEIYISTDRVAENAAQFGQSYRHELHRVLFHGALHLCGLRDKTKQEQDAMRAAEDAWIAAYEATTGQTL